MKSLGQEGAAGIGEQGSAKAGLRPLRVLQIVPYYPPAWGYGGPPRVMFSLARALVRRGHSVSVFTTDAWDETRRIVESRRVMDGVVVHAFRNVSNRFAWRRKMFLPRGLIAALRRYVDRFDVVHVSAVRSVLHARVFAELRRARTPYVIDAHGALPKPVGWRQAAAAIWDPLLLRPFLRGAGALLAQTDHEAKLYRTYVASGRVEHLPLPVELEDLDQAGATGLLRQRLGVDAGTFVILFLGRIEARKGLHFLIEAVNAFARATSRPIRLALVGRDSGGLADVLAQVQQLGLGPIVCFLGPMYGAERVAAYRDADVFALTPGYWEETSLAALEACAVGTPCVITRQAEIPGLDAAGAGVTVRYGDHAAVVTVLERLAEDADLRRRMGAAAAALVREHFAVGAVAERLEAILARVVGATEGGRAAATAPILGEASRPRAGRC